MTQLNSKVLKSLRRPTKMVAPTVYIEALIPIHFQTSKTRMRTSFISFLLISSFIFSLFNTNDGNQADQLKKLIRSERSSSSFHYDSWTELDAHKLYRPVAKSPQEGLMAADKITALPGQPAGVDFNQYAGYVTVDPNTGRALFYYFVESPHKASMKPLVLWLNGGPGCSSLGYGAMTELGPFRVNSDGKTLSRNYHAWNEVANVIFLESPAGVGFSYSNTTSDYEQSGDRRTAEDAYTFLVNWLERFPQYKSHDFFITGESYAGHYVPELAYTILHNNKITNQTIINLRGIATGNAYVDRLTSYIGRYDYYWGHALISDQSYYMIKTECNFALPNLSNECLEGLVTASEEVGFIDDQNIYAPLCQESSNSTVPTRPYMGSFDPCSENYVYSYLNLPEVQEALHANVTALPYPWVSCSGLLPWTDRPASMLPIIQQVISRGISVWFYSGDTDARIPFTTTKLFIKKLRLPVENSWRPWYSNNEVGGYVEGYKGLTFVTVRGAGHMVPSYQPDRALTMITSFLLGQLPPYF